ncbi:hypothetical protein NJB14194_18760, partial [Mycobacterium montefiorense]
PYPESARLRPAVLPGHRRQLGRSAAACRPHRLEPGIPAATQAQTQPLADRRRCRRPGRGSGARRHRHLCRHAGRRQPASPPHGDENADADENHDLESDHHDHRGRRP